MKLTIRISFQLCLNNKGILVQKVCLFSCLLATAFCKTCKASKFMRGILIDIFCTVEPNVKIYKPTADNAVDCCGIKTFTLQSPPPTISVCTFAVVCTVSAVSNVNVNSVKHTGCLWKPLDLGKNLNYKPVSLQHMWLYKMLHVVEKLIFLCFIVLYSFRSQRCNDLWTSSLCNRWNMNEGGGLVC